MIIYYVTLVFGLYSYSTKVAVAVARYMLLLRRLALIESLM